MPHRIPKRKHWRLLWDFVGNSFRNLFRSYFCDSFGGSFWEPSNIYPRRCSGFQFSYVYFFSEIPCGIQPEIFFDHFQEAGRISKRNPGRKFLRDRRISWEIRERSFWRNFHLKRTDESSANRKNKKIEKILKFIFITWKEINTTVNHRPLEKLVPYETWWWLYGGER